MKKVYVSPEVEYINFYSEEEITNVDFEATTSGNDEGWV
jgi:hypothetical protein